MASSPENASSTNPSVGSSGEVSNIVQYPYRTQGHPVAIRLVVIQTILLLFSCLTLISGKNLVLPPRFLALSFALFSLLKTVTLPCFGTPFFTLFVCAR